MAAAVDPNWSTDSGAQALQRHAPDAAAALDRLAGLHPDFGEHDLTALVRAVCADTLSLPPLSGAARSSGPGDATTRVVEDFAEQFSVDVSAIDDRQRGNLAAALGDRVGALAPVLYFADWIPRVRAGLDALFGPSAEWPVPADRHDDESKTWPLINKFMVATARLHELDPVTTEIVRIRQARQHNCRLCKSLRNRTALQAGVSEDEFDKVDDYRNSDLSAGHKAALAFADALIWQPGYISDETAAALRQHFSPAEAVELTLDLMRNACNKVAVSTGTDGANVSSGVEIYDVSPEGEVEFGLAEPAGYR